MTKTEKILEKRKISNADDFDAFFDDDEEPDKKYQTQKNEKDVFFE